VSEQAVSSAAPAALAGVLVAGLEAAVLATTAHAGAVALLCAVGAIQAAVGIAWVSASAVAGRDGAVVIGVLAAAGADVAVALSPHARLQPLLPVLGLAVPGLFLHQLQRRSRREHVMASLAATAVLVVLEVAPTALLQLRVEFGGDASGGAAVSGAVLAGAAAVAVAVLLDLVAPVARFDAEVRGGMPGLLAAAAVGAAVGYLALRDVSGLSAAGAMFAGLVVGVVAGLLGVAAGFLSAAAPAATRGALTALLPISLTAPVALLVLLAVRP
jgi:hypothetical protein